MPPLRLLLLAPGLASAAPVAEIELTLAPLTVVAEAAPAEIPAFAITVAAEHLPPAPIEAAHDDPGLPPLLAVGSLEDEAGDGAKPMPKILVTGSRRALDAPVRRGAQD